MATDRYANPQSSLIRRQNFKTLTPNPHDSFTSNSNTFETIMHELSLERTKTQKLQIKIFEKEKVIEDLQAFNRSMRLDYERSQKELFGLLEEKNQTIEQKTLKLEELEAKLQSLSQRLEIQKNDIETDLPMESTPVNKSKSPASDLISTKSSSFRTMIKSCQRSQRSLNFDAISSTSEDFLKRSDLQGFFKDLFSQILKILKVSYLDEILPKLGDLLENVKIYSKFHSCLAKAIIDCSPSGVFSQGSPSIKQQWKWIKNVMLEYMQLKKNEHKFAMSMSQFISPKLSQRLYEDQ